VKLLFYISFGVIYLINYGKILNYGKLRPSYFIPRSRRTNVDIAVKKFLVQTVRTEKNLAILEDHKTSNNLKKAQC
jgi:hypothetical protein